MVWELNPVMWTLNAECKIFQFQTQKSQKLKKEIENAV